MAFESTLEALLASGVGGGVAVAVAGEAMRWWRGRRADQIREDRLDLDESKLLSSEARQLRREYIAQIADLRQELAVVRRELQVAEASLAAANHDREHLLSDNLALRATLSEQQVEITGLRQELDRLTAASPGMHRAGRREGDPVVVVPPVPPLEG